MNAEEAKQLVFTIIASVGGAGVIILGLSSWLGKIWAEQIYQKTQLRNQKEIEEIKQRYNTELEHLRSEINARRDLLNAIQNSLSSGYSLSQRRTLQAVEVIWAKILEIREFSSMFLFPHTILYPSEFEKIPFSQIDEMLPRVSMSEHSKHIHGLSAEVEKHRPFVGEKLWRLFSMYNAFTGRLTVKMIKWRENGRFYPWDKDIDGTPDTHLFELLQDVFTDEELNQIISSEPLEIVQQIMRSIEEKILAEMNELCIGRKFVSISIDEQQRIERLLSSYSRNLGAG